MKPKTNKTSLLTKISLALLCIFTVALTLVGCTYKGKSSGEAKNVLDPISFYVLDGNSVASTSNAAEVLYISGSKTVKDAYAGALISSEIKQLGDKTGQGLYPIIQLWIDGKTEDFYIREAKSGETAQIISPVNEKGYVVCWKDSSGNEQLNAARATLVLDKEQNGSEFSDAIRLVVHPNLSDSTSLYRSVMGKAVSDHGSIWATSAYSYAINIQVRKLTFEIYSYNSSDYDFAHLSYDPVLYPFSVATPTGTTHLNYLEGYFVDGRIVKVTRNQTNTENFEAQSWTMGAPANNFVSLKQTGRIADALQSDSNQAAKSNGGINITQSSGTGVDYWDLSFDKTKATANGETSYQDNTTTNAIRVRASATTTKQIFYANYVKVSNFSIAGKVYNADAVSIANPRLVGIGSAKILIDDEKTNLTANRYNSLSNTEKNRYTFVSADKYVRTEQTTASGSFDISGLSKNATLSFSYVGNGSEPKGDNAELVTLNVSYRFVSGFFAAYDTAGTALSSGSKHISLYKQCYTSSPETFGPMDTENVSVTGSALPEGSNLSVLVSFVDDDGNQISNNARYEYVTGVTTARTYYKPDGTITYNESEGTPYVTTTVLVSIVPGTNKLAKSYSVETKKTSPNYLSRLQLSTYENPGEVDQTYVTVNGTKYFFTSSTVSETYTLVNETNRNGIMIGDVFFESCTATITTKAFNVQDPDTQEITPSVERSKIVTGYYNASADLLYYFSGNNLLSEYLNNSEYGTSNGTSDLDDTANRSIRTYVYDSQMKNGENPVYLYYSLAEGNYLLDGKKALFLTDPVAYIDVDENNREFLNFFSSDFEGNEIITNGQTLVDSNIIMSGGDIKTSTDEKVVAFKNLISAALRDGYYYYVEPISQVNHKRLAYFRVDNEYDYASAETLTFYGNNALVIYSNTYTDDNGADHTTHNLSLTDSNNVYTQNASALIVNRELEKKYFVYSTSNEGNIVSTGIVDESGKVYYVNPIAKLDLDNSHSLCKNDSTYCYCNVFGSGETTFEHNSSAKVNDSTITLFDNIDTRYLDFTNTLSVKVGTEYGLIESDDNAFDSFVDLCNAANALFKNSYGFNSTKDNVYNSALVWTSVNYFAKLATGDEDYNHTRAEIISAFASLLGCSDTTTFQTKISSIANAFTSASTESRLKYDGSVYTQNGYYILPFAFQNKSASSVVLSFVIINAETKEVRIWIDDINSLFAAASGTTEVFGRCFLFEEPTDYKLSAHNDNLVLKGVSLEGAENSICYKNGDKTVAATGKYILNNKDNFADFIAAIYEFNNLVEDQDKTEFWANAQNNIYFVDTFSIIEDGATNKEKTNITKNIPTNVTVNQYSYAFLAKDGDVYNSTLGREELQSKAIAVLGKTTATTDGFKSLFALSSSGATTPNYSTKNTAYQAILDSYKATVVNAESVSLERFSVYIDQTIAGSEVQGSLGMAYLTGTPYPNPVFKFEITHPENETSISIDVVLDEIYYVEALGSLAERETSDVIIDFTSFAFRETESNIINNSTRYMQKQTTVLTKNGLHELSLPQLNKISGSSNYALSFLSLPVEEFATYNNDDHIYYLGSNETIRAFCESEKTANKGYKLYTTFTFENYTLSFDAAKGVWQIATTSSTTTLSASNVVTETEATTIYKILNKNADEALNILSATKVEAAAASNFVIWQSNANTLSEIAYFDIHTYDAEELEKTGNLVLKSECDDDVCIELLNLDESDILDPSNDYSEVVIAGTTTLYRTSLNNAQSSKGTTNGYYESVALMLDNAEKSSDPYFYVSSDAVVAIASPTVTLFNSDTYQEGIYYRFKEWRVYKRFNSQILQKYNADYLDGTSGDTTKTIFYFYPNQSSSLGSTGYFLLLPVYERMYSVSVATSTTDGQMNIGGSIGIKAKEYFTYENKGSYLIQPLSNDYRIEINSEISVILLNDNKIIYYIKDTKVLDKNNNWIGEIITEDGQTKFWRYDNNSKQECTVQTFAVDSNLNYIYYQTTVEGNTSYLSENVEYPGQYNALRVVGYNIIDKYGKTNYISVENPTDQNRIDADKYLVADGVKVAQLIEADNYGFILHKGSTKITTASSDILDKFAPDTWLVSRHEKVILQASSANGYRFNDWYYVEYDEDTGTSLKSTLNVDTQEATNIDELALPSNIYLLEYETVASEAISHYYKFELAYNKDTFSGKYQIRKVEETNPDNIPSNAFILYDGRLYYSKTTVSGNMVGSLMSYSESGKNYDNFIEYFYYDTKVFVPESTVDYAVGSFIYEFEGENETTKTLSTTTHNLVVGKTYNKIEANAAETQNGKYKVTGITQSGSTATITYKTRTNKLVTRILPYKCAPNGSVSSYAVHYIDTTSLNSPLFTYIDGSGNDTTGTNRFLSAYQGTEIFYGTSSARNNFFFKGQSTQNAATLVPTRVLVNNEILSEIMPNPTDQSTGTITIGDRIKTYKTYTGNPSTVTDLSSYDVAIELKDASGSKSDYANFKTIIFSYGSNTSATYTVNSSPVEGLGETYNYYIIRYYLYIENNNYYHEVFDYNETAQTYVEHNTTVAFGSRNNASVENGESNWQTLCALQQPKVDFILNQITALSTSGEKMKTSFSSAKENEKYTFEFDDVTIEITDIEKTAGTITSAKVTAKADINKEFTFEEGKILSVVLHNDIICRITNIEETGNTLTIYTKAESYELSSTLLYENKGSFYRNKIESAIIVGDDTLTINSLGKNIYLIASFQEYHKVFIETESDSDEAEVEITGLFYFNETDQNKAIRTKYGDIASDTRLDAITLALGSNGQDADLYGENGVFGYEDKATKATVTLSTEDIENYYHSTSSLDDCEFITAIKNSGYQINGYAIDLKTANNHWLDFDTGTSIIVVVRCQKGADIRSASLGLKSIGNLEYLLCPTDDAIRNQSIEYYFYVIRIDLNNNLENTYLEALTHPQNKELLLRNVSLRPAYYNSENGEFYFTKEIDQTYNELLNRIETTNDSPFFDNAYKIEGEMLNYIAQVTANGHIRHYFVPSGNLSDLEELGITGASWVNGDPASPLSVSFYDSKEKTTISTDAATMLQILNGAKYVVDSGTAILATQSAELETEESGLVVGNKYNEILAGAQADDSGIYTITSIETENGKTFVTYTFSSLSSRSLKLTTGFAGNYLNLSSVPIYTFNVFAITLDGSSSLSDYDYTTGAIASQPINFNGNTKLYAAGGRDINGSQVRIIGIDAPTSVTKTLVGKTFDQYALTDDYVNNNIMQTLSLVIDTMLTLEKPVENATGENYYQASDTRYRFAGWYQIKQTGTNNNGKAIWSEPQYLGDSDFLSPVVADSNTIVVALYKKLEQRTVSFDKRQIQYTSSASIDSIGSSLYSESDNTITLSGWFDCDYNWQLNVQAAPGYRLLSNSDSSLTFSGNLTGEHTVSITGSQTIAAQKTTTALIKINNFDQKAQADGHIVEIKDGEILLFSTAWLSIANDANDRNFAYNINVNATGYAQTTDSTGNTFAAFIVNNNANGTTQKISTQQIAENEYPFPSRTLLVIVTYDEGEQITLVHRQTNANPIYDFAGWNKNGNPVPGSDSESGYTEVLSGSAVEYSATIKQVVSLSIAQPVIVDSSEKITNRSDIENALKTELDTVISNTFQNFAVEYRDGNRYYIDGGSYASLESEESGTVSKGKADNLQSVFTTLYFGCDSIITLKMKKGDLFNLEVGSITYHLVFIGFYNENGEELTDQSEMTLTMSENLQIVPKFVLSSLITLALTSSTNGSVQFAQNNWIKKPNTGWRLSHEKELVVEVSQANENAVVASYSITINGISKEITSATTSGTKTLEFTEGIITYTFEDSTLKLTYSGNETQITITPTFEVVFIIN